MPLSSYPSSELQPRYLNEQERENPYEVVYNFFDYGNLPEIREMLWEWFRVTVTGSFHREDCKDRVNMIHFYEQLEKLVEAIHVIHQRSGDTMKKEE